MNIIEKASEASTMFESTNSELKKAYLIRYIQLYNDIVSSIPGYKGSFGTGYPFYALGSNLSGDLPVIEEQIRYNKELLRDYQDYLNHVKLFLRREPNWECENCLENNGKYMPNLKYFCSRCPEVSKKLRPRKVINRLPDVDLWMVVDDGYEKVTEKKLLELFDKYDIKTSDVDPIKTINDVYEIALDLKNDKMPSKHIPMDTHIINYSELYKLIENIVSNVDDAREKDKIPYMPILPYSLRKKWQHDDEAYNFVHDYLYSLTDYNFESKLLNKLLSTRKELADKYSTCELERIAILTGSDVVARRQQNPVLKKRFEERINLWKEL